MKKKTMLELHRIDDALTARNPSRLRQFRLAPELCPRRWRARTCRWLSDQTGPSRAGYRKEWKTYRVYG